MSLNCPLPLSPVAGFLDQLSLEKLATLGDVYSPGVVIENPLHRTRGMAAARAAFERMFRLFPNLTLTVDDVHGDDQSGFLAWTLVYQAGGRSRSLHGASHVEFARDGRVALQRDHWDATFPVYARRPFLGWLLHRARRQHRI